MSQHREVTPGALSDRLTYRHSICVEKDVMSCREIFCSKVRRVNKAKAIRTTSTKTGACAETPDDEHLACCVLRHEAICVGLYYSNSSCCQPSLCSLAPFPILSSIQSVASWHPAQRRHQHPPTNSRSCSKFAAMCLKILLRFVRCFE